MQHFLVNRNGRVNDCFTISLNCLRFRYDGGGPEMKSSWYPLAVQSRKEAYVGRQLASYGFLFACPKYKKVVTHARKRRVVFAPLFPGYVFISLDLCRQDWRLLNSLPGSLGLLQFNYRPSALDTDFVSSFIDSMDVNGIPKLKESLNLGDRVQAIGGPFDRMIGEVVEMSSEARVKILIEALNRKVELTMPRQAILSSM